MSRGIRRCSVHYRPGGTPRNRVRSGRKLCKPFKGAASCRIRRSRRPSTRLRLAVAWFSTAAPRASIGLEPFHSLGGRAHSQAPPMRACFSSDRSRTAGYPLAKPELEVLCASLMCYLQCTPRGGERVQLPDDYGG
jgi:hypothetical protein